MLARDRDARWVDDVGLGTMRTQPARQPEPIATGLEGNRNARHGAAGRGRLILPSVQQPKQRCFVRLELLQRLSFDSRNDPGDEPARLTHLDDGNDSAILLQGSEASVQVAGMRHGGTPSVVSATIVPCPRRSPHSISILCTPRRDGSA